MASREFQLVIFGASGFTAEYIIENLVQYIAKNRKSVTWAVAGRNESKIGAVLRAVGTQTGTNLDSVAVIQADAGDAESLNNMAKRATVLVNCTGPYRDYGEPVVKACVDQGTHYLDITGEPEFMESMQLKYHKVAEEKKVYVISACGFDSIPCELGVNFLRDNFEGKLVAVESYLVWNNGKSESSVNSTTWDCAVEGFAHVEDLKGVRRNLYRELFFGVPKENPEILPRKTFFRYADDHFSGWGLPFVGSDRSVVRRSQMYNYLVLKELPVLMEAYAVMGLSHTLSMFVIAAFLKLLGPFTFGRSLLKRFPALFTFGMFKKGGPNREDVDSGFFTMTFNGRGFSNDADETKSPDKEIVARLEGPNAYITTAICVNQSFLTLLEETDRLPGEGGVLTPGAAFRKTSLTQRLGQNGIKLSVIKK